MKDEGDQVLAGTAPDPMDLGSHDDAGPGDTEQKDKELRRSQRAKKPPISIYEDPDFTEDLEFATPLSSDESSEDGSSDDGTEYDDLSSGDEDQSEDNDDEFGSDVSVAIGQKYSANNEYIQEEDGGVRLLSRATKTIRFNYSKMRKKDQEAFDQDTIVLRQLLTLDPKKIYVDQDLEDPDIHDRALRLLYRARFGQDNEYTRISPYIRYDKLSKETIQQVNQAVQISEKNT